MTFALRRALPLACCWAWLAPPAFASPPGKSSTKQPTVVATVDGEEVYEVEVREVLADALGKRRISPEALARLQAGALDQVINRRLVARHLAQRGLWPGESIVDDLVADLKRRLDVQGLSFDDFLSRRGLTEPLVRRQLAWKLGWKRYLETQLTDEALQAYFEANRRQFDGTLVRVSHILLRVEDLEKPASVEAAVEKAGQLRSEILAGKLSFAAAAKKHSAGPSRRQGGDLGFVARHGSMVEAFSQAAFALEQRQISEPVLTGFGVHLIQCTEIKPGNKTWQQVRRELEQALARQQFSELARQARSQARIEIVDAGQGR